ncbi:MAG: rhodanese-like domain-containing protein [Gammaproteobacteria bacterium]|nr:rhodanese-like domain-containing protein [Gammaproteobacteria bacterium]
MALKHPVAKLVDAAKSRINNLSAEDVKSLIDKDQALIVDIRDIRERQKSGKIPGSVHAPRGMLEFWFDPESPYFRDVFDTDKTIILHCALGHRSALAADTLTMMGFDNIAHIETGFDGWVKAGGSVEMPDPT